MIYRIDQILEYCKGKKVLHLGYVQHSPKYKKQIEDGTWLHAHISKVAKEAVGLDILEDAVDDLQRNYGYKGYVGNVERLQEVDLKETFDVIVAGELIEHLENPGLFLEGVKNFLREDSILIITTPNAFGETYQKMYNRKPEAEWVNEEHVTWYSSYTLQRILERCGYEESLYGYYFGYETLKSDVNSKVSVLKYLRLMKRKWSYFRLKKNRQIGLLFVTKLASLAK